ncbi:MAG: GDSL-type esterase/lipase family protein [Coprococcus sp.]
MAYKIICYGDSNTYGACGFVGGRHHADIRWTGILQNSGLYDVVNLGENGREIPSDQWELNELTEILRQEGDFDLLTVMLGTNDLLTMVRSGSARVAVRMEQFLTEFLQVQPMVCRPEQVLLIAPPSTALGEMAPSSTGLDEELVVSLGIIMRILQRNFIFILLMHLSGLSNWGLTGYI